MVFANKTHHKPGQFLKDLEGICHKDEPLRTAVVHPVSGESIGGALECAKKKILEPVLIGPRARIEQAAREARLSLKGIEIVDVPHSHAAAAKAVGLVRAGEADCLMKGAIHTDEFLAAILDKNSGLRTERRLSHIFYFDIPYYHKPLLVTDAAINIRSDLMTKRDIVQNAIDFARAIGIETPKVALLSAVETVNPHIQSTVDAAALCKMADRGQITGGLLDGPLAYDNAISKAAAKIKGIKSDVAGDPDILIAPDLEAANILAKQLLYMDGTQDAGIVLGARVPIILTSRSADASSRLRSAYLAHLFHHYARAHVFKYLGH